MLGSYALLQYNTCFWALVHSGKSRTEAQDQLKVSKRLGQIELARLSKNICQTILSFAVMLNSNICCRALRQTTRMSSSSLNLVSIMHRYQ
jgi:hypothetical protein